MSLCVLTLCFLRIQETILYVKGKGRCITYILVIKELVQTTINMCINL